MGKKQISEWKRYARGIGAAVGIYLACMVVLALLLAKGVLPESRSFPAVAVCCFLSPFLGGICVGRSALGRWGKGAVVAAGFAVILIAVGLLCWDGILWAGHGGILLLCALAGGLLSGAAGRKKRGRRVQRKGRRRAQAL